MGGVEETQPNLLSFSSKRIAIAHCAVWLFKRARRALSGATMASATSAAGPSSASASASASAASSAPAAATTASDRLFLPDEARVAALAKEKPWAKSGGERHFRKVKVSAVAAMKMQAHAASGVEKGLASANRMPVEVMGLV